MVLKIRDNFPTPTFKIYGLGQLSAYFENKLDRQILEVFRIHRYTTSCAYRDSGSSLNFLSTSYQFIVCIFEGNELLFASFGKKNGTFS